jgi:tetratricopeptide (TPR) repeat protein
MSLLIKALNKAEEAQAQNAKTEQVEKSKKEQAEESKAELELEVDVSRNSHTQLSQNSLETATTELELSLSPTGSSFSQATANTVKPTSAAHVTATSTQQSSVQHAAAISAANVFSAKGLEAKTDSARLAMIAGGGLIALLGMGLYFYQFVDSSPPIVVPARPLEQIATAPQPDPQSIAEAQNADAQTNVSELADAPLEATSSDTEAAMPPDFESVEPKPLMAGKKTKKATVIEENEAMRSLEDSIDNVGASDESVSVDNEDGSNRLQASFSANKANSKLRKSKSSAAIASESASFSVTKSTPQPSVNPVLMSAYQAYNAGNDAQAQQLYKQVLKQDIHNVDALLGLGAIASRQGRSADATAWYGKVLEVDPRNNIAQAALLDNQSQGNELINETSLKTMLAKQPEDVNLHVALGNLYAEQNQWPAAQQAYFDAYSLNKTADNAYNLAVSLDQMGKSKLALPYYQHALEHASNASNIDKAALLARITAIQ